MIEDRGHRPSAEAWCRFTLLDGALLIAAFAVGMAMVTNGMRDEIRPDGARTAFHVGGRIVLLGLQLSGPPILLGQWVRGRRVSLGFGERLWLVSLALANEETREQLAASRARIVEAGDAERRRLERNLHDGAQQRLVSLSLSLRLAQARSNARSIAARARCSSAARVVPRSKA